MKIEDEIKFIKIKHKYLKENVIVDRKPAFKFDVSINGSESLGKMINIKLVVHVSLNVKGVEVALMINF